MSNLAIGIALGSSMNSSMRFNGEGSLDGMPVWLAWVMLISLTICVAVTIVQAYRGKLDLLDNHWLIWLIGPPIGACIWAVIACVVGLFGWLISLIL